MSDEIRVCTLVTATHIPFARVLARSLRQHDPGATLLVLVVDRSDDGVASDEPFDVITLADLGAPEGLRRLAFQYDARELCMALKARLHAYVLEQTDWERWLFLDADIMVWGSLAPLFEALDDASILLSAHTDRPYGVARDALFERELFHNGVFNGGMVGLRRGAEAEAFVAWFQERLDRFCFTEYLPMLLGDQSWLTLVPAFFRGVEVIRHPGVNVAFWNVEAKRLDRAGDRVLCDGEPLLFFHYSGLELPSPTRLSQHEVGQDPLARPVVRHLVDVYVDAVLEAGYLEHCKAAYGFARYDDGRLIGADERRAYYEQCKAGTAPDNPFARPPHAGPSTRPVGPPVAGGG